MIIKKKEVPVLWKTDIIVVGSGSSGATAAIAAAKTGKQVTLIEKNGFLGGTSTGVLDTFYGFYTPGKMSRKIVGGVPDDVIDLLFKKKSALKRPNTFGAGTGITYNPEILKCVWEEVAAEAGVKILFHSFCTDVLMEGEQITGVIVNGKNGLMKIKANVVIDATGDADIAYLSGAPFENAGDLAPAQSMTTTFRLANVDSEKASQFPRKELVAKMKEANQKGDYNLPREEGSIHKTPVSGIMHAIMTRVSGYKPTDPVSLSEAERQGRKQAQEYIRFLVDQIPGYENAKLIFLSTQIGIRETRRIYGDYRLNKEDVTNARKFGDTVGQCGAPIEEHHSGNDTHWEFLGEGAAYDIPYRALVAQKIEGLLVVGRCFSADHIAHASCRNMAPCMAMGQAAGAAAGLSVEQGVVPRNVDIEPLQKKLIDMGAVLYDHQNRDKAKINS